MIDDTVLIAGLCWLMVAITAAAAAGKALARRRHLRRWLAVVEQRRAEARQLGQLAAAAHAHTASNVAARRPLPVAAWGTEPARVPAPTEAGQ